MHSRLQRLRWTTFTLVVLAYVLSYFHRMSPATIATDLQQAFATSGAVLGGIAATYFYVYTAMQLPTGVLVDTLGSRRILALGGVIAGIGSLLFAWAETVFMLSTGRLLVGLGVSVTFIAMLKLHAAWFQERHFGTVTGLSILLGNLGSVLAAAPLAWILTSVSWRAVFETIGWLSLAIGLASGFWVRNNPADVGLPTMRALDGKDEHATHQRHWWQGLKQVTFNRSSWPPFWINVGLCGSFFAFAGLWSVPFLSANFGMPRNTATLHSTLLLAGFALGALMIGTLSDRLGRRKPVMIGFALLYLGCWLPLLMRWSLPSEVLLLLFLLMGVGAAAFTLSWACVKEVNPHALSGMAMSIANTGAFFGTGLLQPLVGWSVDLTSAYDAGIWILFGFAALGLIAISRTRETYCRYSEPHRSTISS